MAQNHASQQQRCPKCHAQPGEPCMTLEGYEAEKVHYGRPHPSPREVQALEAAQRAAATSRIRPNPNLPGILLGSEYVGRNQSIPYAVWFCACGESSEAVGAGVGRVQRAYEQHAACRQV